MAMITSIETPTTLGMPTFMHNASSKKACRGGVWIVLKNAFFTDDSIKM
jgi:hypothetical protein